MRIYTKTGDKGKTSLFGGKRVAKDSVRIEACGAVDELNAVIGLCRSFNTVQQVDGILEGIQNDLFTLGADLATPHSPPRPSMGRIRPGDITRLEKHIDTIESSLKPLKNFILPGGSRSAAMLHVARSVCRRAERIVVSAARTEDLGDRPTAYLNRLSDLLFVVARWVNALSNTEEKKWKQR